MHQSHGNREDEVPARIIVYILYLIFYLIMVSFFAKHYAEKVKVLNLVDQFSSEKLVFGYKANNALKFNISLLLNFRFYLM